jgi:pyrroline-5-carboxylate reductase
MKIAVIGAGKVGSALGSGWAKAGHTIIFGVRDAIEKAGLPGAVRTDYSHHFSRLDRERDVIQRNNYGTSGPRPVSCH